MSHTFLILTGGQSRRFGSDKSQIILYGKSLINRLLENLPAGEIIIIGPYFEQSERRVTFIQEHPAGGGPVAAIAAGLEISTSEEVVIVATDMPFAAEIVQDLLDRPLHHGALVPIDSEGKRQPLCARYKKSSLLHAISLLGEVQGQSMRTLMQFLDVADIAFEPTMMSKLVDIDTPEDLHKVRQILPNRIEER